ncbi:unnamed protein product [Dicrocoelium dendriticum]|nr:unnamed protein product [Dicrocoelium dendriticum]
MLYTETTVDLNIQFTAKKIIQRGQTAINATIYGYSFPLGLYNDSLCAYTQPGCPIQADGTVYNYTYGFIFRPASSRYASEICDSPVCISNNLLRI